MYKRFTKRITCVLIEDEPLAIEMMEDYIGRRDDLILLVVGSELSEVKSILDKYKPSIIFLDLVIPPGECGGFHLGQIPPDISVVVVSATPLNHFRGKLPAHELYELPKPVSYESFERCVNEVLKKRPQYCDANKLS